MKRITRSQAIEDLRDVLLRMVDEQNSLCRVVAWRRIFCGGFSQWSQAELESRFPRIPRRAPGLPTNPSPARLIVAVWQRSADGERVSRADGGTAPPPAC